VAPTAEHSCNTLHIPRRTFSAALALRTSRQTNSHPAQPSSLPRPPRYSHVRRPPTVRSILSRIPRTSGSAHIGRNPPQPVFSEEQSVPAFRVLSAQSPTRTATPLRNQSPKAPLQSSANAMHPQCPHESPATRAATRTRAQKIPCPPPTRQWSSASARLALETPRLLFAPLVAQFTSFQIHHLQRRSMSPPTQRCNSAARKTQTACELNGRGLSEHRFPSGAEGNFSTAPCL
jgi:hypothetical protein